MAFRHIRSIISEASADQTLYTVPSGKEFMLLRTRARYEGGSSSGDGSGDIIASNGTVIFARVNGAFNRAGTTTVHGVTAPYYSRILDSSTSYYVTRVYSMAHQSVIWIITTYDASGTAENWVEDEGFSAMAYATSTETSPVGLTFESEHGTPPTFSLGGNSSGGSSVEGNVSVSFKVNSGNAFETINIDHNTVANGKTWMTLCEAGSVIRANSTNADAMAEIMGIELKAGSWESVGGNGGGGGEPAPGGESSQDYFYVEALENGSTIACENFSSSYGLSSSMDKVTWTTLTGNTVATGVQAGTKVYLRGNTSTLGSTDTYPGCRFYSDKAFKAGGRVLSLYSPTLEQKELMNKYDLRSFFYDKEIRECSVDFRPVRSATLMFSYCSSLSALPEGFSIPNVTSTVFMFSNCSSLSALPDGFNIPNVTDAVAMFLYCSSLSALPDGFSAPNVTKASRMFERCSRLSGLPDGFSTPNATVTNSMFEHCSRLSGLPDGFSVPNTTNTDRMFYECSNLSRLPDGFSAPNVTNAGRMFGSCSSLSAIGHNVKIANGIGATSTDNTGMDKSLITSIGDSFEWFTNAKFEGNWDPSKGIRNVFPNATSVGPGWRVYDHYDGEGNGGGGEGSSSSSSGSGGGSPSGRYLRVTSSETVGGCAQLYSLIEGDPSMTPFYDTNPLNYHGVTSGGWVITIVYRDVKSIVDFYVANQNIPQTYHAGISGYQWQSLADAISRIQVWNDDDKGGTINMTLTLE